MISKRFYSIDTNNRKTSNTMLFLLFTSILFQFSCNNTSIEKIKIAEQESTMPVERGINVSIKYTDAGYTKAKVFAPVLERYDLPEKQQSEMPKGITAYFYNDNHKITSYLKSKYAMRDDRNQMMYAKNEVIVVNNRGDTLRTDELTWDERMNKIISQKFVKITTPDQIIMGTGLESNTEFTKYRVFNITGIISLRK